MTLARHAATLRRIEPLVTGPVNIPPRGRVRIAFLPDDRPGEWMYHCHILEHHASGMMGHFEVVR